jgi:hypothetical protein
MVVGRTCSAHRDDGEPCRAAPGRDSEFCLWHDPEQADAVAEARRLGGLRRRRERTLEGAYDVGAFDSVETIRRIVEIVTYDALGMENSVARGRLLIAAAQTLTKLLEVGELEQRVERIEAAMGPRLVREKGRRR